MLLLKGRNNKKILFPRIMTCLIILLLINSAIILLPQMKTDTSKSMQIKENFDHLRNDLQADAGGPYIGMVNTSINLSGSATGGQTPYEFYWDLDNDSEFDDATGTIANYTWNLSGIYVITLQVIDASANESVDTANVTIIADDLIANAGGPYEGSMESQIIINGTASGGLKPYEFFWDLDNDSIYDDAEGANLTHIWYARGVYPISVKVVDSIGHIAFDNTTVLITGVTITIGLPQPHTIYLWNIPMPYFTFSLIIGPFTVAVEIESDVICNLSIAINDEEIFSDTNLIGSKKREVKCNDMCMGMHCIKAIVTDIYGKESVEAVSVLVFSFGRLLRP
jgi:hypothetical protein